MKDDTISRAAAIDAVNNMIRRKFGISADLGTGALLELPSATDTNVGGNLIDRQAAIDALDKRFDSIPMEQTAEILQLRRDLRHLPSAQPGWIPWDSDRFPEESGTYTITAYDGATKRVTYAKYQKRLKRWELTGARAYWRVLAWQPLPTPYREGGQDDGKD